MPLEENLHKGWRLLERAVQKDDKIFAEPVHDPRAEQLFQRCGELLKVV